MGLRQKRRSFAGLIRSLGSTAFDQSSISDSPGPPLPSSAQRSSGWNPASPVEWLRMFVMQHNEHRIVVTRAIAWVLGALGPIDFRVLTFVGNLALAGIVLVFWAEFRGAVGAPLLAAAGFVVCQMTFYEGALLSMAATGSVSLVS